MKSSAYSEHEGEYEFEFEFGSPLRLQWMEVIILQKQPEVPLNSRSENVSEP
jgi:hypothetical protein